MKSRLTAALIGVALTLTGLLVLEGVSRALLTAQADLAPEQPDWYRYTPDLGGTSPALQGARCGRDASA